MCPTFQMTATIFQLKFPRTFKQRTPRMRPISSIKLNYYRFAKFQTFAISCSKQRTRNEVNQTLEIGPNSQQQEKLNRLTVSHHFHFTISSIVFRLTILSNFTVC